MKIQWIYKNIINLFIIIFIVFSCQKKPTDPVLDNVYDPQNVVTDSIPPLAVIKATPDTGITNETDFVFDASESVEEDFPETNLFFQWDMDNDGSWDSDWSDENMITKTFTTGGGAHVIRLNVKGAGGLTSETSKSVYVNSRPVAQFSWAVAPEESWKVNFDATASTDFEDVDDLLYRWDYDGDGTWDTDWSNSKITSKSFGDYAIVNTVLEVKDSWGVTNSIAKKVLANTSKVTDIDGNVYITVKLGDQIWMAENLKVIHYRNGDPVPEITNNIDWILMSTGAYCNYNNDESNVSVYGRLYNCFAVRDNRGLAPEGWHVATNDDWIELEMYLGMSSFDVGEYGWRGTNEGGQIKETGSEHWQYPNAGATNETGFNALPGGFREVEFGDFLEMGTNAYFWTTSIGTYSGVVYYRNLYYNYSDIYSGCFGKNSGLSVRCVKD